MRSSASVPLVLFVLAICSSAASVSACIGEFETCPITNDCVLVKQYCGKCPAGQYLCPSMTQCVDDVKDCAGLRGTFWDFTLSVDERVEMLVNATTLDEQIQQLQNAAPSIPHLYIPEYQWLNDDLHGVNRDEATSFPNGCGLGATWNPETLAEVGSAIGTEARAIHHFYVNIGERAVNPGKNGQGLTMYGPNVNLVRDPRWGRNQEVNSEDPLLTSKLTEGIVKGAQTEEGGYVKALACCKHYAVYDLEDFPEHRFVYNAEVNNRNMYETYLPVFEVCATKANVGHFMCSYNSVNGVPACGNKALLTDILRNQWNYTGFVVSDYDAWAMITTSHHYCANMTCAAAVGINAGCDQEGGGNSAIAQLPAAVEAGMVKEDTVRRSFRRLFRQRIRLGMLDPPTMVPFAAEPQSKISSPKHMELTLRAARESMCLYKNNNSVLPLSASAVNISKQKVAVVGPNAAATIWLQGNYAKPPAWGVVSILEGISNALVAGSEASVLSTCMWDTPGALYNIVNDTFSFVNSADACAVSCAADLSCNYFTFSAGRCYRLKNMWQRQVGSDISIVSGARPGLCLITQGTDWTAVGDQPVRSEDSRECCQRCRADPNCTRFTFDSQLGWCFLRPSAKARWLNPNAYSGESSVKNPMISFSEACLDGMGCWDTKGFDAAAAAASEADATVVVLGLTIWEKARFLQTEVEAEGFDRLSIVLPENQYNLVQTLRQSMGPSKPLIAVLVHGGTFVLGNILDLADAVIDAHYPSQQGGNAVADVIFGFYNPAGRATATWYKSDDDLPPTLAQQDLYPNASSGYLGLTYRYFTGTPQIPFGAGISYTTFSYSTFIAPQSVAACDVIKVNVSVRNTGNRSGDEVVQLYLIQLNASVPVPQIRLVDFVRVKDLLPGEERIVILSASPEYRCVVYPSSDAYEDTRFVEGGSIKLQVGGGQRNFTPGTLEATVQVTGSSPLSKC